MTTTTSARLPPLAVGVALFAVVLPWLCYVLEAATESRAAAPWLWPPPIGGDDPYYCLSWRVMVEAGNAKGWRAVPAQCVGYVRVYMAWGQYHRDVGAVAELDVDDTCLSNQPYYQVKQFGYVYLLYGTCLSVTVTQSTSRSLALHRIACMQGV
jgi:hypothetical protein